MTLDAQEIHLEIKVFAMILDVEVWQDEKILMLHTWVLMWVRDYKINKEKRMPVVTSTWVSFHISTHTLYVVRRKSYESRVYYKPTYGKSIGNV